MAKIPLNLFKRKSQSLTTVNTKVYEAPIQRAGIVINALASNLTDVPQTITAAVSTVPTIDNPISTYFEIIKNFELAPNDATNIVVNKLVLFQGDILMAKAGTTYYPVGTSNPAVNITLSILEAVNIP